MRRIAWLLAVLMLLAACGNGSSPPTEPETGAATTIPPDPVEPPALGDRPPDLVLIGDTGERLTLSPISYCWSGPQSAVCADGMPVEPYPVLVANRSFILEWPLGGWSWTITSASGTDFCTPSRQVLGVRPGGLVTIPPGEQMSAFGRGPGGDAWFVFTADFAGPVDSVPVQASLGWAAPADQLPDGSHLWVSLANLDQQPTELVISATVDAGQGTVDIALPTEWSPECWTGAVSAYADPGAQAADLAGLDPPFQVVVTVDIDGRRLVSDPITWPDDFPSGSDEGPSLSLHEA